MMSSSSLTNVEVKSACKTIRRLYGPQNWEYTSSENLGNGTVKITLTDPHANNNLIEQTARTVAYVVLFPLAAACSIGLTFPVLPCSLHEYCIQESQCYDDACSSLPKTVYSDPNVSNSEKRSVSNSEYLEFSKQQKNERDKRRERGDTKPFYEYGELDKYVFDVFFGCNYELYKFCRPFGCFCPSDSFVIPENNPVLNELKPNEKTRIITHQPR